MSTASAPRWAHVVVVMMENHAYGEVIGNRAAPYLNSLAGQGVSFTAMHAITHPSEPNYVALLSGSTQGLSDDSCPHTYSADNLAAQVRAAGHSFTGFAEGLVSTGYLGCTSGLYARRHCPWTDFADLPRSLSRSTSALPTDPAGLPSLAMVVPNLDHDMHNGTVAQGDTWVREHLAAYARWAPAHRSLLVVTWDEDDHSTANHIPTIAVGDGVHRGRSTQQASLYNLLASIETGFHVARLGGAAHAAALGALGV